MQDDEARPGSGGAAESPHDPADGRVKAQGGPLNRPGTEQEEAAGRSGAPKALDDPSEPPMSESS